MTTVRLDPEAEQELQDAAAYYAARSRDVARRFLSHFLELSRIIAAHPYLFPALAQPAHEPRIRRALVRAFPYAVIYLPLEHQVSILAVAHVRRAPGYWLHRLRTDDD